LESLESRQLLSAAVPNIMPMGDSITESMTGHASYRYWLWNSLADAGYTVNFTGIGADVGGGAPLYPGFDSDHEGHGGWRADDLQAELEDADWKSFASLPQNKPDIVLLHIGSNDVEQDQSDTSTRDEIGAIIDDLRAINPNVTILLARLIPESDHSMSGLNSLLPALVSAKNTSQSPVMLVDQATGFDPATDTFDGVHPNESGEKKMAAKWYAALAPLLPSPTPQPQGTYLDTPAVRLTNSNNAVGPVEFEKSNGSDQGNDGQMISLRGQTFMRGFGVHANSEMDFDLSGGTYTRFRATVGVDDEVEGLGSVVFKVFVNNETTPRFSSQTLTGEDAAVPVDVDITGAKTLRLVVTDAGNDNDFDHADWALARVIGSGNTTNPPPTNPPPVDEPPTNPPPVDEPPTNPPPVDEPPPNPGHRSNMPLAPRNLRGKYHANRVDLTWTDAAINEMGYRVVRRLNKQRWQTIGTLGVNAHSFRDSHIAAGARYYYRVVAFNAYGSKASNSLQERIPAHTTKAKKVKASVSAIESNIKKVIKKVTTPVLKWWNVIEKALSHA
jgi:hypothetical protein